MKTERQGESGGTLSEPQHANGVLAALTLRSWGHNREAGPATAKSYEAGRLIELMGTGCDSELLPAVCTRFPEIACHHQSIVVVMTQGSSCMPGAQCPSLSSGTSQASVNYLAAEVAEMYSSLNHGKARAMALG